MFAVFYVVDSEGLDLNGISLMKVEDNCAHWDRSPKNVSNHFQIIECIWYFDEISYLIKTSSDFDLQIIHDLNNVLFKWKEPLNKIFSQIVLAFQCFKKVWRDIF